jgi:glyoxylate/hydroxypyruvate reductase A
VKPKILFLLPPAWKGLGKETFAGTGYDVLLHGTDEYQPGDVTYFVGFRPPHGFLKSLPNLKLVISLGAGVDGFLGDPQFPKHVPLVRFRDASLALEMAQYVLLQVLMIHRQQRYFDRAQAEHAWRQLLPPRPTDKTRIGILGLGDIGGTIAGQLAALGFAVSGWSRSRKNLPGITSFAGDDERPAFLGQCDMLVCVLPLTPETKDMLNAEFFAALPRGAWVINVARGTMLVEEDLIAALDSDHLEGAVLDVFRTEPLPPDSPIWRHPKITATPHIAGITDPRVARRHIQMCVQEMEAGRLPPDIVVVDRGY